MLKLPKQQPSPPTQETPRTGNSKTHTALTVIGIVMCVILVPILIVNCTLIVKSFVNREEVPDFFGLTPLIVLTDSMYPDIKSGDLIFCRDTDAAEVMVGDTISFFDPASSGTAVVTHQVIEIIHDEDGTLSFRTKGINNNTEDRIPVPAEKLVGKYTDVRIPGAGNVAIFMQSTAGLVVCVLLPLVAFVAYDIIRRRLYEKKKGGDVAALMAELEALRAAQAAPPTADTAPEAQVSDQATPPDQGESH